MLYSGKLANVADMLMGDGEGWWSVGQPSAKLPLKFDVGVGED